MEEQKKDPGWTTVRVSVRVREALERIRTEMESKVPSTFRMPDNTSVINLSDVVGTLIATYRDRQKRSKQRGR